MFVGGVFRSGWPGILCGRMCYMSCNNQLVCGQSCVGGCVHVEGFCPWDHHKGIYRLGGLAGCRLVEMRGVGVLLQGGFVLGRLVFDHCGILF